MIIQYLAARELALANGAFSRRMGASKLVCDKYVFNPLKNAL